MKGGTLIIIIFPWLSLLVGLCVAFAARRQIHILRPSWRRAYLMSILLYESLVLFPVGMFFFISYPAWSALYLAEPPGIHAAFGFVVMLVSVFASIIGYQLGDFLLRRGLDRHLISSIGACALGLFVFILLVGSRLGRLSQDGLWKEAPSSLGSELGVSLLSMLPFMLGGWIYLLVLFDREGRKIALAKLVSAGDMDDEITQEPTASLAGSCTTASYDSQHCQRPSETIDRMGEQPSNSRVLENHFFGERADE